ncbi:Anthranilate N-benzoyltransferase protein, putative [Ricinus communis]|uniref:Anthranilate N-benzoyltransferase protein, putative n=1 Tax=Ricinus communis TaxID=3988 RepID=B9T854_RICCO|nr:Anthranilate N-benzoyltransferase protein, putative [Ricinus communis]|eukprot:XP_025015763.1 vinorine synthase-like [Ricinus communis]
MESLFISKEIIKPSSSHAIHLPKPFRLSFLDQIIPTTYIPLIFFYSANDNNNFKKFQISTQLKISLSENLSTFYPFSGRVKDNLFIDNYEEGVPFIETRVKSHLTDFLEHPQVEFLNQFLPCQPFSYLRDPETIAPIAIQLNFFDCGGIALGVCMSHKITDATTMSAFLNNWANNLRGFSSKKIIPDLSVASSCFPPLESPSSQTYLALMEKLWSSDEHKDITKRFVFDANAILNLKAQAKSESVDNPTRIKAISSFIWKCCTTASRSISAASRPSLSVHTVNIRQRTKPCLSVYTVGNIFWWAIAATDVADTKMGLENFAALTNESIEKLNHHYVNTLQGERGPEAASEFLNQLVEIVSEKPEIFSFSSWLNFGFNELDFGWGKPIWVGLLGELGPAFRNLVIFKESMCNNGIEAWVTLDKNIMDILEEDPEFLKFATPNPGILMP